MSRCRETAGILFKKRCAYPSTQTCAGCAKPICRAHVRMVAERELCIECGRTSLKDSNVRSSQHHLRDDPYFYWYYSSSSVFEDDYDDGDYELFASGGGGGGDGGDGFSDVDSGWEGT